MQNFNCSTESIIEKTIIYYNTSNRNLKKNLYSCFKTHCATNLKPYKVLFYQDVGKDISGLQRDACIWKPPV